MEWVKIIWDHKHKSEPYEIYMEIGDDRYDIRKLEMFKDGSIGYAYEDVEVNGTGLNEEAFPSVEEYNQLNNQYSEDDETLYAENIGKEVFENLWNKIVK